MVGDVPTDRSPGVRAFLARVAEVEAGYDARLNTSATAEQAILDGDYDTRSHLMRTVGQDRRA
jgi:hypothetical protein